MAAKKDTEPKVWTPEEDGKVHISESEYVPGETYGMQSEWDVIVDRVVIYPGMHGEANFLYIGVNGNNWQVPRGRQVDLPVPLYDRYLIWKADVDRELELRAQIENKGRPVELRRI